MAEANNNSQHVSYTTNDFAIAPPAAERTEPLSYAERHNPQYSYRNSFQPVSLVPDLPPAQPPAQAPAQAQGSFAAQPPQKNVVGAGGAAGAAGVGAAAGAVAGSGAAAAAAGPRGVTAGTWVSVKVGFVRSLEDELRKSFSDYPSPPTAQRWRFNTVTDHLCACFSYQSRAKTLSSRGLRRWLVPL